MADCFSRAASTADSELLSGGSASAGTDVYCTSATAACASAVTFPGSMQSHLQDLLPLSTDGNGVLVRALLSAPPPSLSHRPTVLARAEALNG